MPFNNTKRVLSNGLCILSVKKKTNDLVLLSLTDFNTTDKCLFDMTEKKMVFPQDLKFNVSDIELIQSCIKSCETSPVKTSVAPVEAKV